MAGRSAQMPLNTFFWPSEDIDASPMISLMSCKYLNGNQGNYVLTGSGKLDLKDAIHVGHGGEVATGRYGTARAAQGRADRRGEPTCS